MTAGEARARLTVDEYTWNRICKGIYRPTKNLIFSLAIALRMSLEDACQLLECCQLALDYAEVKDTVIAYLLSRNIFNPEMVRAALEEYKVDNLFLAEA